MLLLLSFVVCCFIFVYFLLCLVLIYTSYFSFFSLFSFSSVITLLCLTCGFNWLSQSTEYSKVLVWASSVICYSGSQFYGHCFCFWNVDLSSVCFQFALCLLLCASWPVGFSFPTQSLKYISSTWASAYPAQSCFWCSSQNVTKFNSFNKFYFIAKSPQRSLSRSAPKLLGSAIAHSVTSYQVLLKSIKQFWCNPTNKQQADEWKNKLFFHN